MPFLEWTNPCPELRSLGNINNHQLRKKNKLGYCFELNPERTRNNNKNNNNNNNNKQQLNPLARKPVYVGVPRYVNYMSDCRCYIKPCASHSFVFLIVVKSRRHRHTREGKKKGKNWGKNFPKVLERKTSQELSLVNQSTWGGTNLGGGENILPC